MKDHLLLVASCGLLVTCGAEVSSTERTSEDHGAPEPDPIADAAEVVALPRAEDIPNDPAVAVRATVTPQSEHQPADDPGDNDPPDDGSDDQPDRGNAPPVTTLGANESPIIGPVVIETDDPLIQREPQQDAPGSCVAPPSDLVAWWTGDEDGSERVAGNDLSANGEAASGVAGFVSGALELTGTGYFEADDADALDVADGDFSIDLWVRTTDSTGVVVLLDKRDEGSTVQGYSLFLYGGEVGFQLADGAGSANCSSDPSTSSCTNYIAPGFVADGQWHFIAVTVDRDQNDGLAFYLDGQLVGMMNPTVRPGSLSNSFPLRLGSRSSLETGLLRGTLDEVEIFSRALQASEILALYDAGSQGKCKEAKQSSVR